MVGGLYAIDRIIGHGVRTNDNAVYYLVKWLGQPASEATWESEESLMVTAGPVILHYRLASATLGGFGIQYLNTYELTQGGTVC